MVYATRWAKGNSITGLDCSLDLASGNSIMGLDCLLNLAQGMRGQGAWHTPILQHTAFESNISSRFSRTNGPYCSTIPLHCMPPKKTQNPQSIIMVASKSFIYITFPSTRNNHRPITKEKDCDKKFQSCLEWKTQASKPPVHQPF